MLNTCTIKLFFAKIFCNPFFIWSAVQINSKRRPTVVTKSLLNFHIIFNTIKVLFQLKVLAVSSRSKCLQHSYKWIKGSSHDDCNKIIILLNLTITELFSMLEKTRYDNFLCWVSSDK